MAGTHLVIDDLEICVMYWLDTARIRAMFKAHNPPLTSIWTIAPKGIFITVCSYNYGIDEPFIVMKPVNINGRVYEKDTIVPLSAIIRKVT